MKNKKKKMNKEKQRKKQKINFLKKLQNYSNFTYHKTGIL